MKKAGFIALVIASVTEFLGLMAWGMLNQESAMGKSGITIV